MWAESETRKCFRGDLPADAGGPPLKDVHLSPGVLADLPWHVVGAPHECASDVVVVDGDDDQRKQKVNQEDQDRVDLRMHLIGQRVRHTVPEGDVGIVPVTLRGDSRGGVDRGGEGAWPQPRQLTCMETT